MADPISPAGSLGQTPLVASASSPSVAPPAQDVGGQVARTSSTKAAQESVVLDLKTQITRDATAGKGSSSSAPSLEDSVKEFRAFLKNLPSDLELQTDKESGVVIYKLVNPVTKEVVRQYPSDEIVAMARKLRAMASQSQTKSGIFLDQRS